MKVEVEMNPSFKLHKPRTELRRESDRRNEKFKEVLIAFAFICTLIGFAIGFFVGQRGSEQKERIVRVTK